MNIIEIIRTKKGIKPSSFIAGFALIILLAGIIPPASASGVEASREISTETAYAGGSFPVTVHIKTDQQVEALVLDENLPDGWQINQLENNGAVFQDISTFKESTAEWIWVENLSAGEERTVIYQVTVPSYPETGSSKISGTISTYSTSAVSVGGASELIVTYPPPGAVFSASPLSGTVPLTVQFTDLCTGNPNSWEWDFDGNGSIDSNERNPVYTYENTGTYTVTLRATNSTYGNGTETKTGYITVKSKTSSSGGSGGGSGGGAGSPESSKNIELKEIANEQVFKGTHTCYTFKGGANDIVSVEFDPKKSFGKTTAIVEILKNKSSIVKEPSPGTVYKNINIWVGNSGFSSSENIENARINFRVSRPWISENNVNESSVTLYRYSQDKWYELSTVLNRKDNDYLYFTAETPGFSSFAISSTKKSTRPGEIFQTKNEENKGLNESNLSEEEKQGIKDSDIKKEEDAPGPGAFFAAAELLVSYTILRRRK
ncbi:MAG: PGF-pre-PGF domain-containing protein [Methanosarcina sp.]